MKKKFKNWVRCISITLTFFGTILSSQDTLASDGWLKLSTAKKELKRERQKGNILSSLQCRNSPSVTNRLKPEIKLQWKPNTANRQWIAIAYGGVNNWKPGPTKSGAKNWRRISQSNVKSPTGAVFRCSFWIHKTLKATGNKEHRFIHSVGNLGTTTIELK